MPESLDLAFLLPVVLGFLLIMFRDGFSRAHIDGQNKVFGHKYGERHVQEYMPVPVIGGTGLIVAPLWSLAPGALGWVLALVGLAIAYGAFRLSRTRRVVAAQPKAAKALGVPDAAVIYYRVFTIVVILAIIGLLAYGLLR